MKGLACAIDVISMLKANTLLNLSLLKMHKKNTPFFIKKKKILIKNEIKCNIKWNVINMKSKTLIIRFIDSIKTYVLYAFYIYNMRPYLLMNS